MRKPSYSSIDMFYRCPKSYKFKYVDGVKIMHVPQSDDPLLLGGVFHKGMECDINVARDMYFKSFPVINDQQVNEWIKLEHWLNRGHEYLKEVDILDKELLIENDNFKGIIDLVVDNHDGTVDLIDFKYCSDSSLDKYIYSEQLHLYKYFYEVIHGTKVKDIRFLAFPKLFIKQKNNESLYQFRKRIRDSLDKMQYKNVRIDFEKDMLGIFAKKIKARDKAHNSTFIKKPGQHCKYCQYKKICEGVEDYMLIPKNERVDRRRHDTMDKWIYGPSYSGKSTFMDQFDDTLFANTDGNIDNITSPVVRIKDTFEKQGRMTKKTFAWEHLLDLVSTLEKDDSHGFKKIVLDLIEDLFEHCRIYKYNEMGIQHESDAGYGKGWDMIRSEFLNTIKRLKNIGLEVTYISKELKGSVKNKGGQEISTFGPNITDKVANVLEGTVGATFRLVVNDKERYMSLKNDPYMYGGSRYDFEVDKIPLKKDEYLKELRIALEKGQGVKLIKENAPEEKPKKSTKARQPKDKEVKEDVKEDVKEEVKEEPKAPTKRSRKAKAEKILDDDAQSTILSEETRNGLKCPACDEWQHDTPSGTTCVNGHGGVMGLPVIDTDAVEKTEVIAEGIEEVKETEKPKEAPRRRRRTK